MLYQTNDGSDNFKTEINATNSYFTLDLSSYNWVSASVQNTLPVITSQNTLYVDENIQSGTYITTFSAYDENNDTLTFGISGSDAESFNVDSITGELTTSASLDYESKNSYTFDLNVSDGYGSAAQNITIYVNDLNETNTTYLYLNVINVNNTEHNISSIWFMGVDDNNETLDLSPGYVYTDGDHNLSAPIYNPDHNFSAKVVLNDSSEWWINFTDGMLYQTNDGSDNFKTEINATSNYFMLNLASANFNINSAPIINELMMFGTLNNGGAPSTLIQIDPQTGSLIRTIGDIGYAVNGLEFDNTTGVLYATTSSNDYNAPNNLITIDIQTGQGNIIGDTGVSQIDNALVLVTSNSSGNLYGWVPTTTTTLSLLNPSGPHTVTCLWAADSWGIITQDRGDGGLDLIR
jgi:hypothetical protein